MPEAITTVIQCVARCLGRALGRRVLQPEAMVLSPDVTLGVQVLPVKFSYLTRGKISHETSSVEVYE